MARTSLATAWFLGAMAGISATWAHGVAFANDAAVVPCHDPQADDAAHAISRDWPMWGFDAQRRWATAMELASQLHLQWTRQLPTPVRAWPAQIDDGDKLEFDRSYSPIVSGRMLVVASMVTDSLTAYDTRSGQMQWRFHADGPLRLAPAAYQGNVYAVSDDGYLYCVDAETGELKWKFLGGPEDRRLLGNSRLISRWPARGGPVVRDGRVYFAASVWPLMGTFVHALDAQTGQPEWCNSGSGAIYNLHQHSGADAFGGVAPQGYLAVDQDVLLVAGGRTPPAAFDLETGRLKYFHQATGIIGKGAGGYRVAAQQGWFYNHGWMYSLEDGALFDALNASVLTDDAVYVLSDNGRRLEAYAPRPDQQEVRVTNRLGRGQLRKKYSHRRLWREDLEPGIDRLYLRAGQRLYGGSADGRIVAIDLPTDDRAAAVVWQGQVDGAVWEMIAADDRLFVVTDDGNLVCFGAQPVAEAPRHSTSVVAESASPADDPSGGPVSGLPEQAVDGGGFALVLGAGDDDLVDRLLEHGDRHVIVIDPDADRVATLRQRFVDRGWYGQRVACHAADPLTFPFPPYLAEVLIVGDRSVLGDIARGGVIEHLFQPLRPYGGTAFLPLDAAEHDWLDEWVRAAGMTGAALERDGDMTVLRRHGPLPGAGQWSHQYSDAGNTAYSPDQLARAPLGVLWFGGPCNQHLLPRHGNGPIPQVVGGRLIILGVETLIARDVYTGRELWVKELPGIGHPFTDLDFEKRWSTGAYVHMSQATGIGANYIGSPYVSLADGIYVRHQQRILRLDPKTGRTQSEFALPIEAQANSFDDWGHLSVCGDHLITTVNPQIFDDQPLGRQNWNALSSTRLVVMDRHDGRVLWTRQAELGFRHNAIVAGNGTVFVIDGLTPEALRRSARRGETAEGTAVLALDADTGQPRWTVAEDVFGTWLGYSAEHDVLIQAGRRGISGDRRELTDEPNDRIVAFRGGDGRILWSRRTNYAGPLVLRDDRIIPGPLARNRGPTALLDLLTGQDLYQDHPLTDQKIPWSYGRTYGCSTHNASKYLLTFRSGAAGFADMTAAGGTGNLSGFRAGCTNNLIPADGVLSAPDYTRTCTCSYQQQTSLALIHMPEVELWMFHTIERGDGILRRLGLNLAAPGNRMCPAETLWLNYPSDGGASPDLAVEITAADEQPFRIHASLIDADADSLPWVAGSGIIGLSQLDLPLTAGDPSQQDQDSPMRRYTVRLHFLEPEAIQAGKRVFDVVLQDQTVLTDFDIVARIGGPQRALVTEHRGVLAGDTLSIQLRAVESSEHRPLLCGMEIVQEP